MYSDPVRRATRMIATACVLSSVLCTTPARAATGNAIAPPPLSADTAPADVNSTYGSGDFGRWGVDDFGLPFYSYDIDEATDPMAEQPELAAPRRPSISSATITSRAWPTTTATPSCGARTGCRSGPTCTRRRATTSPVAGATSTSRGRWRARCTWIGRPA